MEKSLMNYQENEDFEQNTPAEPVDHAYKGLVADRKFLIFFVISMVVCFFMVGSYINQQKKLCELQIQEAYMTCSLIDAQEEHLLLKYQLLPEQVGLGELRNAWKDNPCYETSHAYSDALTLVIDALRKNETPFVPENLGTGVKV